MNIVLALVYSLISVVVYSIIAIYIGKTASRHGTFLTNFWIQVLGLPLTLAFFPLFSLHFTLNMYLLAVIAYGAITFFAILLYAKNLSVGPVSVVQAILRTGNLIAFFLAITFLDEPLTAIRILGAILIIGGVLLVSLDIRELLNKRISTLTRAVPLSLLQAAISGVAVLFYGIGTKHIGGFFANVGARLVVAPMFLFLGLTRRQNPLPTFRVSGRTIFLIAFGDVVAFILFSLSIQVYQLSFASMMQSLIPVVTAVIMFFFFGERLRRSQKLGIVLAVAGAMALASGL